MAYSIFVFSGPLVVTEDLGTRKQSFLQRHVEEIGVVAIDPQGVFVASASSPTSVHLQELNERILSSGSQLIGFL